MNALHVNNTILFYDWNGCEHKGTVREITELSDDFGEFYMVTMDTDYANTRFEIEDFNGVFVAQPWTATR